MSDEQPSPPFDDPAFFRQAVELGLDVVLLLNGAGRIVYENPAVERLLGYPVEQRLDMSAFDLMHPDDVPAVREALGRIVAGAVETLTIEVDLQHREGDWRHVEAVARRWVRGDETFALVNLRDVTDRHRTTEALERSNELLSKMLRSSRNIVSLTRAGSGEFVEVNDEWLRVGGYQRDEVIGHTADELGIWGDAPNRDRLLRDIRVGGGQLRDYEVTTYPRAGRVEFIVNVETLQLDGEPHILMIGTDVTESRKVEAQLRQAQKMEALGHLTGGVAHDFNNLLSVVMGNAELLREAIDDPARVRLAETIIEAVDRGAALTGQLLAFSRRQTLAPSAVSLSEVVSAMTPLLESTLPASLRVEVEHAEAWPARVDRAQLENALLNLALNARDAMPEGGRLLIRTGGYHVEAGESESMDVEPGDYAFLSVADTGTGMAEEIRARAFDPFFTTKSPGRGSGLGLSMVYGFVRQSGGDVTIGDRPGGGTVVTLYLPRSPEEPAAGAADVDDETSGGHETIVVLEDEPAILEVMRRMLSDLGYRVVTAADEAALWRVLAEHEAVDLLISDVMLTGSRGGPEIVREAQTARPDMGALLISGYPADAAIDAAAARELPAPVLAKPFTRQALALEVRLALRRRSASPES
jgi:PAS domain S-box-containing protein